MNLESIMKNIDENQKVPKFNYLYNIALNELKYLNKEEKSLNITEPNIKSNSSENSQSIEKKDIKMCKIEHDSFEKLDKEILTLIQKEGLITKINMTDVDKNISNLKEENIQEENIIQEYINKVFLFEKILNIDKNNILDILIFLQTYPKEINDYIEENYDTAYIEYKNKLIEKLKNINRLDSNIFYEIISDDIFHNDIIKILNSKPVQDYINGKRYYKQMNQLDKTETQFDFAEDGTEFIDNLSDEFSIFMKEIKNKLFFVDLFRLKYLPINIRALVDSNLKIVINSLHYDFNDNINDTNKKIILKAVFKILILHEIIHILKYLKPNSNYENIPKTPREREGGKMFINYLFNKPIITRISLDEAKKIHDINNWRDLNKLRNIFPNSDVYPSKSDNQEILSKDYIKLYLSLEEEPERENDREENDNYGDLDIN